MGRISLSISKLSKGLFLKSKVVEYNQGKSFFDNINNYISIHIGNKELENYTRDNYNDNVKIYLYKESKPPEWERFVAGLELNHNFKISNEHISYLMVFKIDEDVYCLTSGLSNNIINSYKDKNFGIRMVTKLFEDSSSVIKYLNESVVGGNRHSQSYGNRGETSFELERKLSTISRDLAIITKEDIQEELGLILEEEVKKGSVRDITIKFGNNIEISKKFNMEQIIDILTKINEIDNNADNINFAIDNISLIEKEGYKQSEVKSSYIEYLNTKVEEDNLNISLSHSDKIDYNNFELLNTSKNKIEIEEEIKSKEDLEKYLVSIIMSGRSLDAVLNYRVYNVETEEEVPVYRYIEDDFIYNDRTMVLVSGEWYTFNSDFNDFYNKKFTKILEESEDFNSKKYSYSNLGYVIDKSKSESVFNSTLKDKYNIIYADKICMNNVEIADAIYADKDENIIVFYHNKRYFNGQHARDLYGQIETSASKITSINKNNLDFKDYIDRLKAENTNAREMVEVLYDLLKNHQPQIIYVACFIEGIKHSTRSNYITYLTSNKQVELKELGIDFRLDYNLQ